MNKNQLDKDFIIIYGSITDYAKKAIKFFKSSVELNYLLSETYLYVENRKEIISNRNDLESFCKTFIKKSLLWKNSDLNRTLRKTNSFFDIDEMDFKICVNNEPDYSIVNELIKEYNKNLTPYERRLFNIWFNLEIRTGKRLAEYLNVSLSLSYRIIKECKIIELKFKKYVEINNYLPSS